MNNNICQFEDEGAHAHAHAQHPTSSSSSSKPLAFYDMFDKDILHTGIRVTSAPAVEAFQVSDCDVADCTQPKVTERFCHRHLHVGKTLTSNNPDSDTQNKEIQQTAAKNRCLLCNRPLRGGNRMLKICSKHYVASEPRSCHIEGCTVRPKRLNSLFCSDHDLARKQVRREYHQRRNTKPFLKDIEALEAQIASSDSDV